MKEDFLKYSSDTTLFRDPRITVPNDVKSSLSFKHLKKEYRVEKVENISNFGVGFIINDESFFEKGSDLSDVQLKLENNLLYSDQATLVYFNIIDSKCYIGLSLNYPGIDIGIVNSVLQKKDYRSELKTEKSLREHSNSIKNEFKCILSDYLALLNYIKYHLNSQEELNTAITDNTEALKKLNSVTLDITYEKYIPEIYHYNNEFQKLVENYSDDEHRIHKSYFRLSVSPILMGAPFIRHTFEKPYGYAGDFHAMVMLYKYDDIGLTLFDQFSHRYACNEPAAVANKNRVYLLKDYLIKEYKNSSNSNFKISSIACGPGRELELFVNNLSNIDKNISLNYVDQDKNALEYAKTNINQITMNKLKKSEIKIDSNFYQDDVVKRLIWKKGVPSNLKDSDVIVCAGLFDYLEDRVAQRLVDSFLEIVKAGGLVIVGNVAKQNPSEFPMSYVLEWELFQRNDKDMENMISDKSLQLHDLDFSVVSEESGINKFLIIRKK